MHTARRTHGFTESVIRGMTRLASEHDAINLAQGFPNFAAPDVLKQAAARAIADDVNQYAITWGAKRLRDALARKYAEWYGMPVNPETDITVTCGATEAMASALLAIVDPGDEVIVFEPFYENYGPDAILCGAKPVYVPMPVDAELDLGRPPAQGRRVPRGARLPARGPPGAAAGGARRGRGAAGRRLLCAAGARVPCPPRPVVPRARGRGLPLHAATRRVLRAGGLLGHLPAPGRRVLRLAHQGDRRLARPGIELFQPRRAGAPGGAIRLLQDGRPAAGSRATAVARQAPRAPGGGVRGGASPSRARANSQRPGGPLL